MIILETYIIFRIDNKRRAVIVRFLDKRKSYYRADIATEKVSTEQEIANVGSSKAP